MRNKLLCLLLAAALTALTGCSLAQPEQKTAFEDRWIGFYVVYNPPGAYNNFSSNPNLMEMGTTSLDTGEYGALTFPREVLLGVEDPDTGNITFPDLEGYSLFIRHRQDEYGPVTQVVSNMSPGEEGTTINSSDQGTAETASGAVSYTHLDFAVMDEIALSMGVAGDSRRRVEAAVLFELTYNLNNGHVFLPREKLIAAAVQLIDCPADTAEIALDDLIGRGAIRQEPVAKVTACYLSRLHGAETGVTERLERMLRFRSDRCSRVDKIIDQIQKEQGIVYAAAQRRAVELAAQEGVLLLTGGPGTGKTTSVRAIVAMLDKLGCDTLLLAPTGRAAKRLGELCGREAQTIHRCLGMSWREDTGEVTFQKNEKEPLEAGAVIVDEMSMVDLPLMEALLSALRPDCRLIMVGDPDQLPSVGPGNVFSDLIRSGSCLRARRPRLPGRQSSCS